MKKHYYVFNFNIFNLLFHCYIFQRPVRPHQKQLLVQSSSPHVYCPILVPLRHLHTNAKPKFITAMDRCFNARHRSSNPVSTCKTFTTAPPKYAQRLITGEAAMFQRSRFLRWPSGPKRPRTCVERCQTLTGRCWSGGELCRSGKLPAPHRSQDFVQLKTFGAVGGTITGCRAYTALP